ncbi:phage portal protein [Oceanobacillus arenosus]|uniref:Phage portal protein n=1 Tax=Oceanobacillus arenosus TaxID=1229153 RepID=A0A3D8PLN3_9BACI|nr:phage portal protein [Oceanobacillus arenosus]RDW17036.1 phage portal protein [Oceanobacillus arenosus]
MVFTFPREEEITPEVVNDFIKLHQAEVPRYKRLKNQYESKAPILDQEAKAEYKPDNRLVVNYAKYIVDTFNGYFIGIPIKVSHDDSKVDEQVDTFLKINDMDDNQAELSKICSIYGHGFEFLYQNEESETCCTYNDPLDMFIVYDDTIAQEPLFAVRYQKTDDGIKGQLFTTSEEKVIAEGKDGLILSDEKTHFYGNVPIIEYIENEERQSIFESVESLINAFNKAISEKANDVDYFADAYMKLLGMELDEDGMRNIRDHRIINLFGSEEVSKLVVEFMEKPNGDASQEHLLDRIERLIYQISMVANINDESFGNASGVSLEFKLQPMKNLSSMKERKFTSGMNRRFKMVFNLPTNIETSKKDEWRNLVYKFTRNIPRNISDEADVASSLAGVVSKETQLSVLSVVDNVKDEIKRIEEEKPKAYPTNPSGDFLIEDKVEIGSTGQAPPEEIKALNGAQITSVLSVLEKVKLGDITREQAIAIIVDGLKLDSEVVRKIVGG